MHVNIVQLLASLTELISWLQPLASQLDQQSPVGDTLEAVQVQCDWLKVRYICWYYYLLCICQQLVL